MTDLWLKLYVNEKYAKELAEKEHLVRRVVEEEFKNAGDYSVSFTLIRSDLTLPTFEIGSAFMSEYSDKIASCLDTIWERLATYSSVPRGKPEKWLTTSRKL